MEITGIHPVGRIPTNRMLSLFERRERPPEWSGRELERRAQHLGHRLALIRSTVASPYSGIAEIRKETGPSIPPVWPAGPRCDTPASPVYCRCLPHDRPCRGALRGNPKSSKDRYQLVEIVAEGGMGTVWRATDLAIRRPHGGDQAAETARRFRRGSVPPALQAGSPGAGTASTPNIVSVSDYGEDHKHPFIVMEFVQGQTVEAVIETVSGFH
jgi:hypothetical protein